MKKNLIEERIKQYVTSKHLTKGFYTFEDFPLTEIWY